MSGQLLTGKTPDAAPPRATLYVGAIPIVANERASQTDSQLATSLAEALLSEQPGLAEDAARGSTSSLMARSAAPTIAAPMHETDKVPTLHLDDFPSGHVDPWSTAGQMLERRARLRAQSGDFVASHQARDEIFEDYLDRFLNLGAPEWLPCGVPGSSGSKRPPRRLALSCWTNRAHRKKLMEALKQKHQLLVHPYQSYPGTAQLALLLSRSSAGEANVLGPPPALSAAVNNKVWFSQVVERLFGKQYLPPSRSATSLSTATLLVRQLARDSKKIVVKLPSSSGGKGNLVFDSPKLGDSAGEIRVLLRNALATAGWDGEELLVSGWETDVLGSPSIQLWIPPRGTGDPIVEGVFDQIIQGRSGHFVGCRPAQLLPHLHQEMVDSGWLLGLLFQHLGYVGRCSFDYLLVGADPDRARLEFLECNGRWGGTSSPMSLVNRLFGNWKKRPFRTRRLRSPGLEALDAEQILSHFEQDLYDRRTGKGWLVFTNLGRPGLRPWASVLGLANQHLPLEDVENRLDMEIQERLKQLVLKSPKSLT